MSDGSKPGRKRMSISNRMIRFIRKYDWVKIGGLLGILAVDAVIVLSVVSLCSGPPKLPVAEPQPEPAEHLPDGDQKLPYESFYTDADSNCTEYGR